MGVHIVIPLVAIGTGLTLPTTAAGWSLAALSVVGGLAWDLSKAYLISKIIRESS